MRWSVSRALLLNALVASSRANLNLSFPTRSNIFAERVCSAWCRYLTPTWKASRAMRRTFLDRASNFDLMSLISRWIMSSRILFIVVRDIAILQFLCCTISGFVDEEARCGFEQRCHNLGRSKNREKTDNEKFSGRAAYELWNKEPPKEPPLNCWTKSVLTVWFAWKLFPS